MHRRLHLVLRPLALAIALAALPSVARAESFETPANISREWMGLTLASTLEINGVLPEEASDPIAGPETLPEPDPAGRISASHGGSHRNKRKLDIRTYGVAVLPGYAMLTGQVVSASFAAGPSITLRGVINASTANQFMVDLSYSRHAMKNPRAMFFRTSVTDQSGFSGNLDIIAPAAYYAATFPFGADFKRSAFLVPRIYMGVGPMFSQATGTVTNAGSKGTVKGAGNQPFFQFIPGLGADVNVYDFVFIGVDLKYRLTLPTSRPKQAAEFSIPKMYVFETALDVEYFFW